MLYPLSHTTSCSSIRSPHRVMIHGVDLTSRFPTCSGHWGRSICPSAFYQHGNAECCIHLTNRCPQWCMHHKTPIYANVVLARHRYPSKLLYTLAVDMAASNEVINVNNKIADSRYFAPPHSIEPLPHTIRWGLIGVGICGLASFISTLVLFSLLFYRLFTWRTHYKTFLGYNQYVSSKWEPCTDTFCSHMLTGILGGPLYEPHLC